MTKQEQAQAYVELLQAIRHNLRDHEVERVVVFLEDKISLRAKLHSQAEDIWFWQLSKTDMMSLSEAVRGQIDKGQSITITPLYNGWMAEF